MLKGLQIYVVSTTSSVETSMDIVEDRCGMKMHLMQKESQDCA